MSEKRPIIIIKKKVSHGGHHGGAWKVAYADFVTAMMALFIVLWLMNTSQQIQKVIGGYFKDPTGTSKKVGTNQTGSGENFTITKDNMNVLKEQLQKTIKQNQDLEKLKKQIEMTVTAEGLRIELLETEKDTFFDSGNAQPTQKGKELLTLLAEELSKLPNKISIEGHTDSRPFAGNGSYTNWELSTDRANSTRRIVQEKGVRANQVSQVRGYADQRLRRPDAPEDPSNRRISMIVQYLVKNADESEKPGAEGGGDKHEGNSHESVAKNEPPAEKHATEPAKH
jgi:chemotaxis protein MotB